MNNESTVKNVTSGFFRGENRCLKLRAADDIFSSGFQRTVNSYYENAVIAFDLIQGYLKGEISIPEFAPLIEDAITPSYTDITTDLMRDHLVQICKRYCQCETRKALFPGRVHLQYGSYDISTGCHAMFDDGTNLELVIFRIGKPSVTQNGKTKDKGVDTSIELALLSRMGEQFVRPGETRNIIASYYFLRKDTDRSTGITDHDFFSGNGGNVVSMEHFHTGGDESSEALEQHIETLIRDFEDGEMCTGDACKGCVLKAVCQFQKPMEQMEKQKMKKKEIIYTPEQEAIISVRNGKYCVVAAPGSGKTECICERVARMIADGTDPENILLITFTNAAAAEMKERVNRKLHEKNVNIHGNIHAVTFHSFALGILCSLYREAGFKKEPEIIDSVRNSVIIKDLLGDHAKIQGLDYRNFASKGGSLMGALACAEKLFLLMKEEGIAPEDGDAISRIREALSEADVLSFYGENAVEELVSMYDSYCRILKDRDKVVYADLERMMHDVLNNCPDYLASLGIQHIIMDEAQDSNDIQFATIDRLWKCPGTKSLMIVGDDDQSIYGFRHTSPENFLRFSKESDVTVLTLSTNRRSTPQCIRFSDHYIKRNVNRVSKDTQTAREDVLICDILTNENGKEKLLVNELKRIKEEYGVELERSLIPYNRDKAEVFIKNIPLNLTIKEREAVPVVKGFYDKPDEMEFIVSEISRLLQSGKKPEDIAVICMKKSGLIDFSAELSKHGIPWIMKNPMNLMENSRVLAAIGLSDAFVQPETDEYYFNYLTARYNGDILEKLSSEEIRTEIDHLKKWFISVMDDPDFEKQKEIFHGLLNDLEREKDEIYAYFLDLVYANESFEEELQYLHDFSIYGTGEAKRMEQDYAGVVLTTAHSSKGLEWDVVFLCLDGFDTETLHHPKLRSVIREGEKVFFDERIEEKRRLIYVAMTRARDLLYVTGKYIAFGSRKKVKDALTGKTKEEDGRTPNQFLAELFEVFWSSYFVTLVAKDFWYSNLSIL